MKIDGRDYDTLSVHERKTQSMVGRGGKFDTDFHTLQLHACT